MNMKTKTIPIAFMILLCSFFVSASYLSDQGTGVIDKGTGLSLQSANLTVQLWDNESGGNILYNYTFVNGIINGSWDLILGDSPGPSLNLSYGEVYYKDYLLNGQDATFKDNDGNSVGRMIFQSPIGQINVSYIENLPSLLESDPFFASWAYNYSNLVGAPTDLSAFNNSPGYISLTGCGNNEVALYNGTSWNCANVTTGNHTVDTDTNLNQSQIEGFGFVTGVHTVDTDTTYTANGIYIYLNGTVFTINSTQLVTLIDANDDDTIYTNLSEFANDVGYITEANDTDTDTQWSLIGSYIYNNSGSLDLNETYLNTTIDARDSDTQLNQSEIEDFGFITGNHTVDTDTTYTANGVYIYLNGTVFYLNETKLITLINSNDDDTTYTNLSEFVNDVGYLISYSETDPVFLSWGFDYNNLTNTPVYDNLSQFSNDVGYLITDNDTTYTAEEVYIYLDITTFKFNESRLNTTIEALDTDTTYSNLSEFTNDVGYITEANDTDTTYSGNGIYVYKSGTVFYLNETKLNITIEALDNDTTYTAGLGLILSALEFSVNMTYLNNTFVNIVGDTMTGSLTVPNISIQNTAYFQNTKVSNSSNNSLWVGGLWVYPNQSETWSDTNILFGVDGNGSPNFFVQNNLVDGHYSGVIGSFIVGNYDSYIDGANMTLCAEVFNDHNITQKVLCEATSADLIVEDDLQVFDEAWFKDESGEYHKTSRELSFLDEIGDDIVRQRYDCTVYVDGTATPYVNVTRSNPNGNNVVILNKSTYEFNISNPYELLSGSYSNPKMNWVYINESLGIYVSDTEPVEEWAEFCKVLIGNTSANSGRIFTISDGQASPYEFIKHSFQRASDDGVVYGNGIVISYNNVTLADFSTTAGKVWSSLFRRDYFAKNTSDGTEWIWVNNPDGALTEIDGLVEITKYGNNVTIPQNNIVNLVLWGVVDDEQDVYYVNVEKNNNGDYVFDEADKCYENRDGVAEYTIPSDFKQTGFYILRTCVKINSTAVQIMQDPLSLKYFFDLRGTKAGAVGGGGGTESSLTLEDVMSNGANTSIALTIRNDLIVQNLTDKIFFVDEGTGKVGVNEPSPIEELEVVGGLCVKDNIADVCNTSDGEIDADGAINANNFDIAEWRLTDQDYPVGTVMCIKVVGQIVGMVACNSPYDTTVGGVVTGNPSIILGNNINKYDVNCATYDHPQCANARQKVVDMYNGAKGTNLTVSDVNWNNYNLTGSIINNSIISEMIALKGEVTVWVKDCDIEPISVGEMLVSSNQVGVAWSINRVQPTSYQQVFNNFGSPFAKALEECNTAGVKKIKAWVV